METIDIKLAKESRIIASTLEWITSPDTFHQKLLNVNVSTWHTYKLLLVHPDGSEATHPYPYIPSKMLSFEKIFEIIDKHAELVSKDAALCEHIADAFELTLSANKKLNAADVFGAFVRHLADCETDDNRLNIYFMLGQRLGTINKHCPSKLNATLLALLHSKSITSPVFAHCLLLIDNMFGGKSDGDNSGFDMAWAQTRACVTTAIVACDTCYATMVHLLPHCLRHPAATDRLLGDQQFWAFIEHGLLAGKVQLSKQTVFMLKLIVNVFQTDKSQMATVTGNVHHQIAHSTWDMYFVAIESLQEVQGHLIISTMDNCLNDIVKAMPVFWTNILLSLLLRHCHMGVLRYAVQYVTSNGVDVHGCQHLCDAFYTAINQTHLYVDTNTAPKDLVRFIAVDLNTALNAIANIPWKLVPAWYMLAAITSCLQQPAVADTVPLPGLIQFITLALELLVKSREFKPHAIRKTIDCIRALRSPSLPIIDLLCIFNLTRSADVLIHMPTLDHVEFEAKVLCRPDIPIATKIHFFDCAIGDVDSRLNLLDRFSKVPEAAVVDFELILFHNLVAERSLEVALQMIKSRVYNILRPHDVVTVDGLLCAATIIEYIISNYVRRDENREKVLNELKEIFENMRLAAKAFTADSHTVNSIRDRLCLVDAMFCTNGKVVDEVAYKSICDALTQDDYEVDLQKFRNRSQEFTELVQKMFLWYLDADDDQVKVQTKARNLIRMLESFESLQCPVMRVFKILTTAEAPVDALFHPSLAKHQPEFNAMTVEALLFGKELKGERKLEYEIAAQIDTTSTTYNQSVRLAAMRYIQRLECSSTLAQLKVLLQAKDTENTRIRYFNNSMQHELKLRYVQAMALLHQRNPIWDEANLQGLLLENNQTNITYINELIIAETIGIDRFMQLFNEIEGNKGLQSFCIIGFYVCCKQKTNHELCYTFIGHLMRYIFAKNLSVRLTAQVVLIRLIEQCDLVQVYQLIYDNIRYEHQTNEQMSRLKKWCPLDDVRLNHIDCNHLLSSVYILREIPRLTQMCADEVYYEPLADYDESLLINSDEVITQRELSDREAVTMVNGGGQETPLANGDFNGPARNTQKKVQPLKQTNIPTELLQSLPMDVQLALDKHRTQSELIVVASLVTKVPNLGGISRTCEVFSVKSCTINNLNDVNRSEFQALSMGSEKWLKYLEVKPQYLCIYLNSLKMHGYTIVGAEQTTYSQPLQHTVLPKRMVLVLGQEKDGIPPNVINLLDMAVEIPQFGVVRSLNVHVSASLFMWEYCKQHLINAE